MIVGVADTHTALWYLFSDLRLSARAKHFIDRAAAGGNRIAISPISIAEVVYLVEKARIPVLAYGELMAALASEKHVFAEEPFTLAIVETMRLIPRDTVPDMPDRIIAATASHLNVPVLSRDSRIRATSLQTIW